MTIPPPNYPPPVPPGPPSGPPNGPPGPGQGPHAPEPRKPGRAVGSLAAVAYLVLLIMLFPQVGLPFETLVGGFVVGLLVATFAVASERLRPYAVGFLITMGVFVIVAGGACIGLIVLLSGLHG